MVPSVIFKDSLDTGISCKPTNLGGMCSGHPNSAFYVTEHMHSVNRMLSLSGLSLTFDVFVPSGA